MTRAIGPERPLRRRLRLGGDAGQQALRGADAPDVVAVSIGNELEKEALIEMDPAVFFTEPHYDGYPAILVRLPPIDEDLLGVILTDAWRVRAPRRLQARLATDTKPPV
ncbi:MAG TPA: hypothetical protein VFO73_07620 [Candidatus Limnocylindrales bacterium]|nr:hypothetical protein [Candidatus Limnocylindrales bacterium]